MPKPCINNCRHKQPRTASSTALSFYVVNLLTENCKGVWSDIVDKQCGRNNQSIMLYNFVMAVNRIIAL